MISFSAKPYNQRSAPLSTHQYFTRCAKETPQECTRELQFLLFASPPLPCSLLFATPSPPCMVGPWSDRRTLSDLCFPLFLKSYTISIDDLETLTVSRELSSFLFKNTVFLSSLFIFSV